MGKTKNYVKETGEVSEKNYFWVRMAVTEVKPASTVGSIFESLMPI
jgi:hypothetical protein